MKKAGVITLLVLTTILFLSVFPSVNVAAEVIDQRQEGTQTCQSIFNYLPTGQEFTPTFSSLLAVEIYLTTSAAPGGEDTIIVNIRESTIDGTILGTASRSVSVPFEGWLRFNFLGGITLTPGSLYVIEVSCSGHDFLWCAQGQNPYPGGRAILDGVPSDPGDKAFRTYSIGNPVGGVVLPTNTLAILTPSLALAGLVAVVSAVVVVKRRRD